MLIRLIATLNFFALRLPFGNTPYRTFLVLIGACLLAVGMGNAREAVEVGDSCTSKPKSLSAFPCIEGRVVDCRNSTGSRELLHCAADELQKVDSELNRIYQRVLKKFEKPNDEYSDYKNAQKALLEGQRAWVAFKKSDCSVPGYLNLKGSIQSNEIVSCEIKHTKSRIADLQALLVQ